MVPARTGRFFTLVMVTFGQGTQQGMSVQLSRSRARDLETSDNPGYFEGVMMWCENEALEHCRGR